jgi:hypothetical protein
LPEELESVHEVLMYQTALTTNKLLTHLQVAEERIYSVEKVTALKAHATKPMSKTKCYNCGKTGHIHRDCKAKAKKAVPSAKQSVATKAWPRRAARGSEKGKRIDWILGAGTSSHIVNDATVACDVAPTRQKVTMVDGTVVAARGDCKLDVVTLVDSTSNRVMLTSVPSTRVTTF